MRNVLFLALALAAPTVAQTPGAPDRSRVAAGNYTIDPSHTQVLWTVDHMGFSKFDGAFADTSGTLTLDPANLAAARLSITIPTTRIVTTSEGLNKHLASADFFDVAKYPTATFTSTAIRTNGDEATITGNLTLHGVTKPITLQTRFIGAGSAPMGAKKLNIGFRATTSIKRSDFGISYAVPVVSDQVNLTINAAFERQG